MNSNFINSTNTNTNTDKINKNNIMQITFDELMNRIKEDIKKTIDENNFDEVLNIEEAFVNTIHSELERYISDTFKSSPTSKKMIEQAIRDKFKDFGNK
jgi:t-SNARE complex subunit (syntaxin)